MAFAQVSTATQVTGTGATVVVTVSSTTAGHLAVVHIAVSTAETCTGVTDNQSNTYVVSAALDQGTIRTYQAYGVHVVGAVTTVTVSFSGTTAGKRCGVDMYSGGETTNAAIFDVSTTGTAGSGTALSVSTLTPSATGNLIVATLRGFAGIGWTAGASYTLYSGSGAVSTRSEYRLSSAASETAPATMATSQAWAEIATSFKPLGAAVTRRTTIIN